MFNSITFPRPAMPIECNVPAFLPQYSAQSLAFFARLSTPPTDARKALYDAMITSLVSAGVWAKLDALYMLAAADQATALTNLVQSSYGATAVGSPSFTADSGFTGGSSKYLDTGFDPTTAPSPHLVQNDGCLFGWGTSVASILSAVIAQSPSNPFCAADPNYGGLFYFSIFDNGTASVVNGDGTGFYAASRSSSGTVLGYKNGSQAGSVSLASSTPHSGNVILLNDGVADSGYTANQPMAGFGASLDAAGHTALYSAVHAYLHAVAGIP